jgi:hypothetical protein
MRTRGGRNVLKARRKRGRYSLTVRMNEHVKKLNWKA